MFSTISLIIFIVSGYNYVECFNRSYHDNHQINEYSMWYQAGEVTGLFLKTCLDITPKMKTGNEFLDYFQKCLRRKSLLVLDRSLKDDVISVSDGIQLVKYRNIANPFEGIDNEASRSFIGDQLDWNDEVVRRIINFFENYELKIDLRTDNHVAESRQHRGHRKKDNMMVSLLVFAMVAVGLIVIPMGFQFLAVLGGKALLLAKLALILTSIQGLKKIATSSFNYGLYAHSAPGGPWNYDRQWSRQQPPIYDSAQGGYHAHQDPYNVILHPRIDTDD